MSEKRNLQFNEFLSQGKYVKALQQLNLIKKKRSLSEDEILVKKYIQIFIHLDKGEFQKGRSLAEELIKDSKKKKNVIREIDGIIGKTENTICLGLFDEAMESIKKGITLLKKIENKDNNLYLERKAYLIFLKGRAFAEKFKMFEAIKSFQKSYELRKQADNKYGMLWSLLNWGSLAMGVGKFREGENYLEKSLKIAEELDCEVGIIWNLINLGGIEYQLRNLDKAISYAERCLSISEPRDYKHSSSMCYDIMGHCLFKKGFLDKALVYFQKSLEKRLETGYKNLIAQSYYSIGNIYTQKGELKDGLAYYEKILKMPEVKEDNVSKPAYLTTIGKIYGELGDFHTAKKYLIEAFELLNNNEQYLFHYLNFSVSIIKTLHYIIVLLVENNECKDIEYYLDELYKLSQKYPEMRQYEMMYRLDKAIVLKSSSRLMDKMKAGTVLKKITKEDIIDHEITIEAMTNLCEVLINELELTGDTTIIQEIVILSDKLLEIAQSQYFYDLLAETYFFKAKISLLQLDINNTRLFLMKAQNTANDHGLKRLANKISNEHDSLLENLNDLEEKIKKNTPLQQRINESRNDFLFSKMVRSKISDQVRVIDTPIYLVILNSNKGDCIYSKAFEEIKIDENLIAGFISAINMFGKEAFSSSGSIDRIKHGEYMIILHSYKEFIFGYVFKGQSYPALSKLESLIEQLSQSKELIKSLDYSIHSYMEISDETQLEIDTLIDQIFSYKSK